MPRHLQKAIIHKKKRESLYQLPVPLSEASRIAYQSWTATQKPTLVYATVLLQPTPLVVGLNTWCYISRGIYHCSILDSDLNFARIPESQETKRRVNAFKYLCIPPRSTPDRGFCDTACFRKINNIF